MPSARINDQKGPQGVVARRHVLRRCDPHQGIIHGALQLAAIHHRFKIENQHRRAAGLFMCHEVIARLTHGIPKHEATLRRIQHIGRRIHRQILRRAH